MLEGDSNTLELGHEVLEATWARDERTEGMVGMEALGMRVPGVRHYNGPDWPEPR